MIHLIVLGLTIDQWISYYIFQETRLNISRSHSHQNHGCRNTQKGTFEFEKRSGRCLDNLLIVNCAIVGSFLALVPVCHFYELGAWAPAGPVHFQVHRWVIALILDRNCVKSKWLLDCNLIISTQRLACFRQLLNGFIHALRALRILKCHLLHRAASLQFAAARTKDGQNANSRGCQQGSLHFFWSFFNHRYFILSIF